MSYPAGTGWTVNNAITKLTSLRLGASHDRKVAFIDIQCLFAPTGRFINESVLISSAPHDGMDVVEFAQEIVIQGVFQQTAY